MRSGLDARKKGGFPDHFCANGLIMSKRSSSHIPILLIVGPPRSGTSIMGRVIDAHPACATWVEPYFVWDRHFRNAPHDERNAADATEAVCDQIRRDFFRFQKGMNAAIAVDKSPRNCLRLPFVRKVFPHAKYLFLSRDGRDAVLSIKKQWEQKEAVFTGQRRGRNRRQLRTILGKWLARRPMWRFRARAFAFELGPWQGWGRAGMLNRLRWEGRFGWGPRFTGWQQMIDVLEPIQFYARQWAACANGMARERDRIAPDRQIRLHYEDFVDRPERTLRRIFSFMALDFPENFMQKIPPILSGNYQKWKAALSGEEIRKVGPILDKPLRELGYETGNAWYEERG